MAKSLCVGDGVPDEREGVVLAERKKLDISSGFLNLRGTDEGKIRTGRVGSQYSRLKELHGDTGIDSLPATLIECFSVLETLSTGSTVEYYKKNNRSDELLAQSPGEEAGNKDILLYLISNVSINMWEVLDSLAADEEPNPNNFAESLENYLDITLDRKNEDNSKLFTVNGIELDLGTVLKLLIEVVGLTLRKYISETQTGGNKLRKFVSSFIFWLKNDANCEAAIFNEAREILLSFLKIDETFSPKGHIEGLKTYYADAAEKILDGNEEPLNYLTEKDIRKFLQGEKKATDK